MTRTELFNHRVQEIADDFDCPKRRVIRVAVALLEYCLIHDEVSYFHAVKKLSDKDF